MHPAAAIQTALANQRALDLAHHPRIPTCSTRTCERARFWRDRFDQAHDELEHLHRFINLRGLRLPSRLDTTTEADHGA